MLDKINHYSLTSPASVYDEEAMTALKLAARTAAKVNEAVEAYNQLEKETGDKLAAQNAFIEKMNDVTMPAEVRKEINELITTGEFDEAINKYLGDLEARLDKIIAGGGEANSEVVDGRTTASGSVWSCLGEAIRSVNRYAFLFCDNSPVVTYDSGTDKTTITFGNASIFYEGKRVYLDGNTATHESDGNFLLNIIYDFQTGGLALAPSKDAVRDNKIVLGMIYKGYLHLFNNATAFEGNKHSENGSAYVDVWADTAPTFTREGDVCSIDMPRVLFFFGGYRHEITAQTFQTTISEAVTTLHNILYDLEAKTYKCVQSQAFIPQNCVHIGFVHRTHGVFMRGAHGETFKARPLTTLMPSYFTQFVKFDSVNKKVTFPADMLVFSDSGNVYHLNSNFTEETVVDYSAETSSALCIYYDTVTRTVKVQAYNAFVQKSYLLLCTFRTLTGVANISIPYTWDGKFMNVIPLDEAGNVKIEGTANEARSFVKSIAHRGLSSVAPENTLAAYRAAKNSGFKYVECDIRFTSDGVPVLLHDDTVDRTSNGTGSITTFTLEAVKALDFGNGETIPTFQEFMSYCKSAGLHAYVELKYGMSESQVKTLVGIVRMYGMRENVSFISFYDSNLEYVKAADATARLGYVIDELTDAKIPFATSLKTGVNEVFINLAYNLVSDDIVTACALADLPLEVWTVEEESAVISLNAYVSGVTTNVSLNETTFTVAMTAAPDGLPNNAPEETGTMFIVQEATNE